MNIPQHKSIFPMNSKIALRYKKHSSTLLLSPETRNIFGNISKVNNAARLRLKTNLVLWTFINFTYVQDQYPLLRKSGHFWISLTKVNFRASNGFISNSLILVLKNSLTVLKTWDTPLQFWPPVCWRVFWYKGQKSIL